MSPQYGKGEWYWNDNELVVSLSKKDFTFNSGSLYEDGRCKKEVSSSQSSSGLSGSDKVALVGAALVIGGLIKLFSSDSDSSSSSSSSSSYSSSSSSSSSIDFVQVEAECINGVIPCIEKNLQVTGGPGRFESNFNQASSGTIHKGYQGNIAGTYSFSVQFDENICTGNFYISGHKEHYRIALGKDCHNNGSGEW